VVPTVPEPKPSNSGTSTNVEPPAFEDHSNPGPTPAESLDADHTRTGKSLADVAASSAPPSVPAKSSGDETLAPAPVAATPVVPSASKPDSKSGSVRQLPSLADIKSKFFSSLNFFQVTYFLDFVQNV
jgi:hypothetical protein